jgi:hypothetical protein
MPEVAPLRWSANPGEQPDGGTSAGPPIYYTAPGGWLIVHEPADHAPDRPWVLRLHGRDQGRYHTLRLAKSAPTRADLLEQL